MCLTLFFSCYWKNLLPAGCATSSVTAVPFYTSLKCGNKFSRTPNIKLQSVQEKDGRTDGRTDIRGMA